MTCFNRLVIIASFLFGIDPHDSKYTHTHTHTHTHKHTHTHTYIYMYIYIYINRPASKNVCWFLIYVIERRDKRSELISIERLSVVRQIWLVFIKEKQRFPTRPLNTPTAPSRERYEPQEKGVPGYNIKMYLMLYSSVGYYFFVITPRFLPIRIGSTRQDSHLWVQ